jgi:hypothetical protein
MEAIKTIELHSAAASAIFPKRFSFSNPDRSGEQLSCNVTIAEFLSARILTVSD